MNINEDQLKIIRDIETRLKTIMIGSISRIEKSFGYLWNHGSDPINESQENFADKWEDLRIEILNHGNNQIRSAIDDLYNHFEYHNKYSYNYNFVLKNKNRR